MRKSNSSILPKCVVLVSAALIVVQTSAQDKQRPTARPSSDADEMFQRMVDECEEITPGVGEFPARFFIGESKPSANEVARREATLKDAFRMSRFEVTQELYAAIAGVNPSRWQGPRNSVERVTIKDAKSFCERLTDELRKRRLIAANEVVRLPTSIEWEYCCRAGAKTRFSFGDRVGEAISTSLLDRYAWHTGNAAGNDPAVGVLKGNGWKLHDMHGYLWEFVDDSSLQAASTPDKNEVVVRGGSWRDEYPLLSCATYLTVPSSESGDHIGFRCVIAVSPLVKKGG